MIDLIRECAPDFSRVQEAEIWLSEQIIGWHFNILNTQEVALAGGCSASRDTAARIAIAELVERWAFFESQKARAADLLLEEYPTSCGFAAGFEEAPTVYRAIAEAIERWCWSKWIDEGLNVALVAAPKKLSPIAQKFSAFFEEILFFEQRVIAPAELSKMPLRFAVALGVNKHGVFPGSRVCTMTEDPWEHALVEAWRHKVIASTSEAKSAKAHFYSSRVLHFATNRTAAFDQIQKAQDRKDWPSPNLKLLKKVNSPIGTHVWRALCQGYKSWHLGPEPRFVY